MAHSRRHRKSRSPKKLRKSTKKCEEGYVPVRAYKSRSGKRSRAHCRVKSARTSFTCSPGQYKVRGHKSRSAKKRSFRVKRHCRKSKNYVASDLSVSMI